MYRHIALRLQRQQWQPGLVAPNFVYTYAFHPLFSAVASMEFQDEIQMILNDSTGDEQQPRIRARFEYYKYIYNIDVYTKVAMIHQLSIPHIRFEKAVLLMEIGIKPQMAVKQCRN